MFTWMTKQKRKKGFTLLELLVVMAVLAVLVAMGVPRFLGYAKDAAVTAMQADAKLLESAALQYAMKHDDAFPVQVDENGDIIVPDDVDADVLAAIADALGVEDDAVELALIDEDLIKSSVRSLKNDVDDFVIVLNKGTELEGAVFLKSAIPDSEGIMWCGIDHKIVAEGGSDE